MSDNYFKVFKIAEDHYKWDKQKEYALINERLDKKKRKEYYNALLILEEILGKDFLKSSHRNNPVRQMIIEKTEFRFYEIINFAETLRELQKTDINFKELQKKLLPTNKSTQEGVPFVEIADRFVRQKFKVNFPVENNIDKSPDIKIKAADNDDIVFIEVSSLNENQERIATRNNYYFFHKNFHYLPPYYSFIGKQKELIDEKRYEEISEIIAQAKKKVEKHEQIVCYTDRHFNFIIVPKKHENELNKIVENENLSLNNIDGLPLNFNLTNQIISKIKKEASQIPSGYNGLIYFPVSPLYFMTTPIEYMIARIEEYLKSFKNILGVVVHSKIVDNNKEQVITIDKHIYRRKVIKNLSYESLYIHNKNSELLISHETFKKVYETF